MKLQVNENIEMIIYSKHKWNSTQLEISENEEYEFKAIGTWTDLSQSGASLGWC